jgi:peptide/nickel transport system substrate-binding protein
VRQAISYAIDVQAMVDKIRLGYAKRQFSNIPASSWAYTDNVPKFDYNPDKAKALLKEAGWTPGPDGILQKDGKPFKFRLFFNSGNKQREQIAVITQQYLKDVGISVDIQQEDFTAYLKRIQQTKDFDMFILGWVGGIDPFATGNIWKSEGSQNFIGYKNPEVDQLYDQAAAVPGCKQEDRKPYYEKIQQLIAEDQGYVFLFTNESLVAVNKRIKVNPLTKLGIGYQLELWQLAP